MTRIEAIMELNSLERLGRTISAQMIKASARLAKCESFGDVIEATLLSADELTRRLSLLSEEIAKDQC